MTEKGENRRKREESRTKARVIRSLPLATHSTRPVALSPLSLRRCRTATTVAVLLPCHRRHIPNFPTIGRRYVDHGADGVQRSSTIGTVYEKCSSRRNRPNHLTLSLSVVARPARPFGSLSPRAFAPFLHCSGASYTYTPVSQLSLLRGQRGSTSHVGVVHVCTGPIRIASPSRRITNCRASIRENHLEPASFGAHIVLLTHSCTHAHAHTSLLLLSSILLSLPLSLIHSQSSHLLSLPLALASTRLGSAPSFEASHSPCTLHAHGPVLAMPRKYDRSLLEFTH